MSRLKRWRRGALGAVAMACVAAPVTVFALVASASDGQQVYKATEFVVSAGLGVQEMPSINGNWVVWQFRPDPNSFNYAEVRARQLSGGAELVLGQTNTTYTAPDISNNTVVWTEGTAVMVYDLATGQKSTLFNSASSKSLARVSGNTVVWDDFVSGRGMEVHAYDTVTKRETVVAAGAIWLGPDLSGRAVTWTELSDSASDVYAYNLDTALKTRVSAQTESVTAPAISGNRVAWAARRSDGWHLLVRDLTQPNVSDVAVSAGEPTSVDIDGDIVVWSGAGGLMGYDLAKTQRFVVSRAVGGKLSPRISGRRVVWTDTRNSGVGKYEGDYSVYGALLEDGPAPPPPAIGVPDTIDARIEIVWPYDKPVTEADIANIEAVLFQSGSLNLPACGWTPNVHLWRALNNDPARLIASGRAVNNIDVSQAKDPANKIYFFAKVDGTTTRWNVWSHGADGRTYYPNQDTPAGIGSAGGDVEAKIEIVWPHDNAPVSQAKLVNIKAMVFQPGTLLSVPPDWNPTVRLLMALNNDVLRPVAVGTKRLVQGSRFIYPVWDFNDIDVSQVPVSEGNKYFFSLEIDGVGARPNVWVHGSSGLTYFPLKDTPTAACDRLLP